MTIVARIFHNRTSIKPICILWYILHLDVISSAALLQSSLLWSGSDFSQQYFTNAPNIKQITRQPEINVN